MIRTLMWRILISSSVVLIFFLGVQNELLVPVSEGLLPFSRQEISTGSNDGIEVNGTTGMQISADYKGSLDNSTDIQRITYNSDEKTLNATLWLNGAIHLRPSSYGVNTVVYGALVDVDNSQITGKFGVDYQKEIQWTNKTDSWNAFLVEYISAQNFRVLDFQRNYTSFFIDNQSIAEVPINLESITSPTLFRVLYYAIVIYNDSKTVLDLSSWIDIPPPKYSFSTIPSPLVFRQGENKEVGLKLVSSTGVAPHVFSYQPLENQTAIIVQTESDKLNQSQAVLSPESFKIKVPLETSVGQYIVPVLANISVDSLFPSGIVSLGNQNISVTSQTFHTAIANMSISVIEAPTMSEQVKEFWSAYGSLISLVAAGFVGGSATYLFDYLKGRGKRKMIERTDQKYESGD
ncbi:MAG TPA: hypothetical protein VIP70_08380 [Nitrososphaeraceae archaeon]